MAADYHDDLVDVAEQLHYHEVLRLLAEKQENLDLPVVWRFADIVEGGWVLEEQVYRGLRNRDRFLIVTEGSTDAHILQKAFDLRRPRVADFFYFVDMKENYPFSGTGNLFNFSKGLARIQIENRVIVLYDNDAEGHAKLRGTASLQLPDNIRAIGLPTLLEFEAFPTVGPTGGAVADINQAAASIECYLDLAWKVAEKPLVGWTTYQPNTSRYQGALVNKDGYTKAFLSLRGEDAAGYAFGKLDTVLDSIIAAAVSIAGFREDR